MSHDVWVSCKSTEKGMMIRIWYIFLNHLHSLWYFFTILVKFHVMKLQIKDIPLSTVNWLISYSIFCFTIWDPWRSSIWLKSFFFSERQKFISDIFIIFLEVFEPGEVFCIPKWVKLYHQGWALSPGIISGHPFWRGDWGEMWLLLILERSQGRRWSKLPF